MTTVVAPSISPLPNTPLYEVRLYSTHASSASNDPERTVVTPSPEGSLLQLQRASDFEQHWRRSGPPHTTASQLPSKPSRAL